MHALLCPIAHTHIAHPHSHAHTLTMKEPREVKFMTVKWVWQVGTGLLTGSKPHTSDMWRT